MKKRDQAQIIKSILEGARSDLATITTLMNAANLSSEQIKIYLSYVLEKDLLTYHLDEREGRRYYRTTPKGLKFIRVVDSIQEFFPNSLVKERL